MGKAKQTAEHERLAQARGGSPWYRWGPYLSERSWGTVREDYSANGAAWNHLTHDMARSKASTETGLCSRVRPASCAS